MALKLASEAYVEGAPIPAKHTCEGADTSPPLAWTGVPRNARALALILDDPDAPGGTWTHWTFWNLPSSMAGLPEGADIQELGGTLGTTSNGHTGYHGPCPPSGTHRYVAKLYALSQPLTLPAGSKVERLRAAMTGRILAETRLLGTFTRA